METYIVWLWVFFKEQIKKKTYLLQLLVMLTALISVSALHFPSAERSDIGYAYETAGEPDWLAEQLSMQEDYLDFRLYETPEELQQAVVSGRIDCGFVIPEEAKDRVICVSSPMSSKSALAKQTLFSVYYRLRSRDVLLEADEQLYGSSDEIRQQLLFDKNEAYLHGDQVFDMDLQEVAVTASASVKENCIFPIQGIAGLFLILFAILSQSVIYDIKSGGPWKRLSRKDGFCMRMLWGVAAMILPVLLAYMYLAISGKGRGAGIEILSMLLFLLWLVPWSSVLADRRLSEETYYVRMVIFLLVQLIICPVFADPAEWLPVVRILRLIFPLGIYTTL